MKAIIIAAGCGSRLKEYHQGIPKSLIEIHGKRIIDDILKKVSSVGINEVIIITGYKHTLLEDYLSVYNDSNISMKFVYNPRWKEANGISVLCAKEKLEVDDEFVLLMSDHIFQLKILKDICSIDLQPDRALLAIDRKIATIPDLDDGMKLQIIADEPPVYTIQRFSKKLKVFDAIDCGIFRLNYSFFSYLEQAIQAGNDSLSDACNLLCNSGSMLGMDIRESVWLDIDTPEMLEQKILLHKILYN